jgi:hypothetical protein
MIHAGLLVTLRSTESPQEISTYVAIGVMKLRFCISMVHAQTTAQFLTSSDINSREISVIILVFMVGTSTGMVLVNLNAIILLLALTEMANSIVTILVQNTSVNTSISTKVA